MKNLKLLNSSFFNKNVNLFSNYINSIKKNRFLNYYNLNANFEGCFIYSKEKSMHIQNIWSENKIKKVTLKRYLHIRENLNIQTIIYSAVEKKLLKSRDKLVDNILFFDFFNNKYYNIFDIIKNKNNNIKINNNFKINCIKYKK
uniref:Uncharacterized protein n=1 Tax=Cyanophora sudae TaxID=1522369 RepID=A0A873WV06_9EUKA|nr:hypothetical protein DXZ12_mgp24 [Cyanophora sudae]QPB15064.1 hypothetical protein [Cyanophora sudae]